MYAPNASKQLLFCVIALFVLLAVAACEPISPDFASGTTPLEVSEPGATASEPLFAAVDTFSYHTCALTSAGGVLCWGENYDGNLGGGGPTVEGAPSAIPVAAIGLESGVRVVRLGWSHGCAVTDADALYCWGYNGAGQLGIEGDEAISMPTLVPGYESGVVDVATGADYTCVLLESGAVECWGLNDFGQLGVPADELEISFEPLAIGGLPDGVVDLEAGTWHACVLTVGSDMWCWGRNHAGQLGDGTMEDRSTPAKVASLDGVVARMKIAGGYSCAVTNSGGLKCWGRNQGGQLGDGTLEPRTTPVDVVGLGGGVVDVAVGGPIESRSCAVMEDGGVKCWGTDPVGQLGIGVAEVQTAPVDVTTLNGTAIAITMGEDHTCALMEDGRIHCWGLNDVGQLGDGTFENRSTPVRVVFEAQPPSATQESEVAPDVSDENSEEGLLLVGFGDWPLSPVGCPGCTYALDLYAEMVTSATGVPVTVRNFAQDSDPSIHDILALLDSDQERTDALAAADIIVVGAAQKGSVMMANDDLCDGPNYNDRPDWSKYNAECVSATAEMYRPLLEELFSRIVALREGQPTRFIAINAYNDWIGYVRGDMTGVPPEGIEASHMVYDIWNATYCETAELAGFACADIYHAFNGEDGYQDAMHLLRTDIRYNPSQEGNEVIAEVLAGLGVEAP